tara:strand:+ start:49317 stop:50507 length:1191 start_codon:yes stop_codon:yes gene_type:complete
MIYSLPHKILKMISVIAVTMLLMVSCGSYQQASYYDDGIYAGNGPAVESRQQYGQRANQTENNAYGTYFGEKADEYQDILESEVFTDVDSYSSGVSNDSLQVVEGDNYYARNNTYDGQPGWGDNPTNVSINIYDDNWGLNGFYGLGWGGYYGWGGYNALYWNNPWYGGWGFGGPWGYNSWAYANPWFYGGGWGYGYYNYGWNRPWYGSYYNRSYAYNNSRRGYYPVRSVRDINSTALRGRSNLESSSLRSNSRYRSTSGRSNVDSRGRSSNSYRSTITNRRSVGVDAAERNNAYRTSRSTRTSPSYNSSSRSSQSYRSTVPQNSTYRSGNSTRTSSPRSSNYSRQAPTQQRSPSYSRPASPQRSSGYSAPASRSSSGGTRSSGGGGTRSSRGGGRN